jgi:hypothetical protein
MLPEHVPCFGGIRQKLFWFAVGDRRKDSLEAFAAIVVVRA